MVTGRRIQVRVRVVDGALFLRCLRGEELPRLQQSSEPSPERRALADLAARLGSELRRGRLRRRMTQQQVAAAAGIQRPELSQIETGRRLPSVRALAGIAMALMLEVVFVPRSRGRSAGRLATSLG